MELEKGRRAILLGATGLVGSQLLQLLINDERTQKILVLTRRTLAVSHPKIEQLLIDFEKPEEWRNSIQGDVLYSAFGTTIKKAGSQRQQYKIDYTFQYEVAHAASKNGVATYVLVSAVGADAKSKVFYNRIKGELDRDVNMLSFNNIAILKPSLLLGDRKENRAGEKMAAFFGKVIKVLPLLKKYRPIEDVIVAKAMLNSSFSIEGHKEYVADELFSLAGV